MTQPNQPQTSQEQGPIKFLEYPLVIDWLQWSDEFRQEMGKPDMPQVALTLISEMKGEIRSLQQKVSELEAERDRYAGAMAIALKEGIFANKEYVKRKIEQALKGEGM